ncbi:MAG: glycosyltransferase [bacterium]
MPNNTEHANPLISVIIPTYNRKETLQKVLHAYGGQTLPHGRFETVVVDDGSTDGTEDVAAELKRSLPNLRYFHQPHGGPAKSRNLGIEKASSGLILFTGDDCIPDKNLLDEHLRLHEAGDAVAVLGHIDWHPELEITPFMRYINIDIQFSYPKIKETPENVPFGYFYTSNISIPRRYLERAGAFDTDFSEAVWEDVELGYRIWKSGVRIVYNPRAVTYHYHAVDVGDYIRRQIKAGRAAATLYRKHPEMVDSLHVTKVASPEVRFRFYQALLDYYYTVGLQEGLQSGEREESLIPLEDRLKNWSDVERDRLAREVQKLENTIAAMGQEIQRRGVEITKRDKQIEGLELRVKNSLAYKIYRFFKKLA